MSDSVLRRKEAPFALATLAGLCGWLLVTWLDRVREHPVVSYTLSEKISGGETKISCEFKNLCADRTFTDLEFTFRGRESGKPTFEALGVEIGARGATINLQPKIYSDDASGDQLEIKVVVEELRPGGYFKIVGKKKGEGECMCLLDSSESDSSESVDLREWGLISWVLEYEKWILGFLAIAALGALAIYLRWYFRNPDEPASASATAPQDPVEKAPRQDATETSESTIQDTE